MLKIIRSQLYQLVLDKVIFIILLLWTIINVVSMIRTIPDLAVMDDLCMGNVFMNWFSADDMLAVALTGLIMTKDFFDKTMLYEPMSGHSRMSIFMGRFLTLIVITETLFLIENWGVILIYSAIHGLSWGEVLSPQGALFRTLLAMLVNFRVCAEFSLVTVLIKRKGFMFLFLAPYYFLPDLVGSAMYYGYMYIVGTDTLEDAEAMTKFFDAVDPYFNIFTTYPSYNLSQYEWIKLSTENGTTMDTVKALPDHTGAAVIALAGIGILALIWACRAFSRKDLE